MDFYFGRQFENDYQRAPFVIVDIGASGGKLPDNLETLDRHFRVVGFEPFREAYDNLMRVPSDNRYYINKALYKEKAEIDFYVTKKPTGSSLLEPNMAFLDRFHNASRYEVTKSLKVEADTLDNQLHEHGIDDVDFVKLDTQGSELFVLQGSERTLQRTFGVKIEVEFAEMYRNQPLFSDVDAFLRSRGFMLFDLQRVFWQFKRGIGLGRAEGLNKGPLIYGDAIYFKGFDAIRSIIDAIPERADKRSKGLKMLSLALMYGYRDFALEIIESIGESFDRRELEALKNSAGRSAIERRIKDSLPPFRGKWRIANVFYSIGDLFGGYEGRTFDDRLGNT